MKKTNVEADALQVTGGPAVFETARGPTPLEAAAATFGNDTTQPLAPAEVKDAKELTDEPEPRDLTRDEAPLPQAEPPGQRRAEGSGVLDPMPRMGGTFTRNPATGEVTELTVIPVDGPKE